MTAMGGTSVVRKAITTANLSTICAGLAQKLAVQDPECWKHGYILVSRIKVVDIARIKRSLIASGFVREREEKMPNGDVRVHGKFQMKSFGYLGPKFLAHGTTFVHGEGSEPPIVAIKRVA